MDDPPENAAASDGNPRLASCIRDYPTTLCSSGSENASGISQGRKEVSQQGGTAANGGGSHPELDHVQVRSLHSIMPSPENDDVYKAIAWDDPEIIELARSIKHQGLIEPILISRDGFIISGHRRRVAAFLAELELVPVRVHPVSRTEDHDAFIKLLVEMNSQRIKSVSDILHETIIKVDPKKAHEQIVNEREEKRIDRMCNDLSVIDPDDDGRRCTISAAKWPLLQAINRVLDEQRNYWPLSDRQIHYRLLGALAPLRHASKPGSRYVNDIKSYRALTDILTRGRINGLIPWEAIDDETRPIDLNEAFQGVPDFLRANVDVFLKGYWRNRQQSQPQHIEICIEKLTVRTIIQQVAQDGRRFICRFHPETLVGVRELIRR